MDGSLLGELITQPALDGFLSLFKSSDKLLLGWARPFLQEGQVSERTQTKHGSQCLHPGALEARLLS